MDIVECMMEQLEQMEENISRARTGDFKVSIHRMEIDRIRYVLSTYLRIRLKKIEQFTSHILQSEKNAETPRLSQEELVYANEYATHMEDHFKTVALRHMPPNLQSIDTKQMVPLTGYCGQYWLVPNEQVQLTGYCGQYWLVPNEQVQLTDNVVSIGWFPIEQVQLTDNVVSIGWFPMNKYN
ncbi:DNA replication complex GINS protein SLD5 [Lamellibrachia satsuma]|nr:DNA replication complex GINS protein SLD5 [Lamellibrachia satsuma]